MQEEKLLIINADFQLQYEKKQECFVLLYPEGMVQLSQSAGEIMNLCNGKYSSISISENLEEKFQTKNLLNDVTAFLKEAMSRKWVLYVK